MSFIGYSTCRIQFTSNDEQTPERNYSDRSTIELRELNFDFSLKALDIENGRDEIFSFPLKKRDLYQFGKKPNQPDEIHSSNGTYRLWLAADSRQKFHQTCKTVLGILFPDEVMDISNPNQYSSPDKPESINSTAKADILLNVHNLSRHIKQGNDDEAARIATQLASQNIRLQTKSLKRLPNEEQFQIIVQFDGNEYDIDQNGGTIPLQVFYSTTVRELRAAFEFAYHYPPPSQYFFVNGNLVQDDSAMKDLMAGPNSLFVLFLLTHSKKF